MNPKASIGKYFFNEKCPDEGVFYTLRQANGKSFVEDCAKRDPYRLSRILKTLKRIFDYGCSFGFDPKTIVEIKGLMLVSRFSKCASKALSSESLLTSMLDISPSTCSISIPSGFCEQLTEALYKASAGNGRFS